MNLQPGFKTEQPGKGDKYFKVLQSTLNMSPLFIETFSQFTRVFNCKHNENAQYSPSNPARKYS